MLPALLPADFVTGGDGSTAAGVVRSLAGLSEIPLDEDGRGGGDDSSLVAPEVLATAFGAIPPTMDTLRTGI